MSTHGTARLAASSIVDAAYGLLRSYGLGDLSMRRLAKELQVQPGALYWHITNKQELIAQLAARILRPLHALDGPPEAHLLGLQNALLSVRDGAEVVTLAWSTQPDLLPLPGLADALVKRGEQPADASLIAQTATYFALGFTQGLQTRIALAEAEAGSSPVDREEWQHRFEQSITLITRPISPIRTVEGDRA